MRLLKDFLKQTDHSTIMLKWNITAAKNQNRHEICACVHDYKVLT